jgi:aspartyl aminopeptidase
MSCFCSLEALTDAEKTLNDSEEVRVIALFDHEEIGSSSAQGAGSNLVNDIFNRVNQVLATPDTPADAYETAVQKSFLVSADMAHALHPNYSDKHQEKHRPAIHKGPVIKINSNQRYATNAVTSFVVKELAKRNNVPVQEFVVRNDMGCGSTIGPILASKCGIRTVDIGIPQLSMHSIREQCGTVDVGHTVKLLSAFFSQFRDLDNNISID